MWASYELYLKTRSFFSQQFLMDIEWFRTGMIGFRKENRQSIIANRYRRIGIASWKINGCKNEFLWTIWITGNRRFAFKWEYLCNERTHMLICNLIGKQTSFFVRATRRYIHRSSGYGDMGVSIKSVWFRWPFGLETHTCEQITMYSTVANHVAYGLKWPISV